MSNRVLRTIGPVVLVAVLVLVIWVSRRVILLLFAGLLIALVLSFLTGLVRRLIPVSHRIAYGILLGLLALMLWGAGVLAAPTVARQFGDLAEKVPEGFSKFREKVAHSTVVQRANEVLPDLKEMLPSDGAGKVVFSTFGAVSSLVFVLFTALFLAATPGLYRRMLIKLFPPQARPRAERATDRAICALRHWLLGQSISMLVVGVVTGGALAIAGIPFAAALGIIAGLAEFVPIIGPIVAAIPALLIALGEGSDRFLIVLGIFVGIQFVESNLLMPIVQRETVDLPPVITLVALLLLSGWFGLLGAFVAAPFAALVLVLIEELYLRQHLKTDDQLLA